MATIGLIGTGLAYLNLKNAQKEYNALVEKQDALLAALDMIHGVSHDDKDEDDFDTNEIDYMDGVKITALLRVGNLVGSAFRSQASVVLTNTGDKTYTIYEAEAECYYKDCPVYQFKLGSSEPEPIAKTTYVNLKPGQTVEIILPGGISVIQDKEGKDLLPGLRKVILNATGENLITSAPKITLSVTQAYIKADIRVKWGENTGLIFSFDPQKDLIEKSLKTTMYRGKIGAIRYCGEAFFPK